MLGIFLWLLLAPSVFGEDSAALPGTNALLDTILKAAVPAVPTDEEFDDEALILNLDGPEVTVFYNERNEADYVEVRTAEKIEEYHYLSHIKYSDLIFVLSDLLRRITQDGYQWATAPVISYEPNEEVVLLYQKDLVNDMVYGAVQFPDFKVWMNGTRQPDAEHRLNAGSARDMMTLVVAFASCLAQAEQALGINQFDYTMKFFQQE
ncbi:hypothetical protein FACS189476_09260 [Spirochaetia bacterium]|nr:hypothetical protein FACS189476_09260 [Spirochaetia bacterium]